MRVGLIFERSGKVTAVSVTSKAANEVSPNLGVWSMPSVEPTVSYAN